MPDDLLHYGSNYGSSYAVSADGRQFLVMTAVGDPPPTAVTVVLNWRNAMRR